MLDKYIEFLESKIDIAPETGYSDIKVQLMDFKDGTRLKPHQRDAINWAIRGGRRALFESFGLGKTIQQLIILNELIKRDGGKALIVCPLGVRQEFALDAKNKLGIEIEYVKTMAECKESGRDILITNYERVRDGDIDPKWFTATSLDEASVLRGYGTKTFQTFLTLFKGVKYRFVCTATPSPNKFKELIHYAGYLEVMDTGQALTRFFQRDSTKANNLTLYPHKEKEFWLWVSTWALFLTSPADLGYDATGYDLPKLDIVYHKIEVDHSTAGADKDGQVKMFRDAALGLKDASKEKRDSIVSRVGKAREIAAESSEDHFIFWHDLEEERHELKRQIGGMVDIYGSQDMELREKRTIDFAYGKIKYLATKKRISGSGCNFQRYCHRAIFVGIDYKFNDFIQAIHRIYRFLQGERVRIDIIYTESEQQVLDTLLEKWANHERMVKNMIEIMKQYGLSSTNVIEKLARTIGVDRKYEEGKNFMFVNNDCVLEISNMANNSVDLIHTSIPFGNHYEYSASYNDFGHNEDNARFFEQMDFLSPELLRVLKPGRVAAIHVKDRVMFGNTTGYGMPSMDFFHADCIKHYVKHGFIYFGMITVVTDVVRENNQTYRLGWSEQCKDGTKMGVGCPEYILLFRKLPTDTSKAYADVRVEKEKDDYTRAQWQIDAHAFWRSNGDRLIIPDEIKNMGVEHIGKQFKEWSRKNTYDYDSHVEISKGLDEKGKLPSTFMVMAPGSWHNEVWDDVNRMLTQNSKQTQKKLNNHICPLQFDIIDRIITRYTNEGDVVLDPFGGIGSVPDRAIRKGRKGVAFELNSEYWKDGVMYCKLAEEEMCAPSLFDFTNESA